MDRAAALAFALEEPAATAEVAESRDGELTARELEVADLVAKGQGNRDIADRLFLSPRTVEKHVEHVMNKLGVNSRAEIAAWQAHHEAPAGPT